MENVAFWTAVISLIVFVGTWFIPSMKWTGWVRGAAAAVFVVGAAIWAIARHH